MALTALVLSSDFSLGSQAAPPLEGQQSGYSGAATIGGPSSVSQELQRLDEQRQSMYQLDWAQRTFRPWFAWKRELDEESRLKLGVNGLFLYQYASEEAAGKTDQDAAGGIYRLQGSWTAFSSESGSEGALEWRLEARSDLGGDLSPLQLGGQYAAALNPGFPYSNDFDVDLSVLSWKQTFARGRAGLAVGRLAFDAYLDAFVTQSPYRGFLNRTFVFSPALATTGAGALGFVVKGFVTEQVWLGGQVYDGNAANGDFDWDTFREQEWLKAIEVGWTPHIDRRQTQRVQFSYWEKDRRSEAGITAGRGWAVSASAPLGEKLLGFTRLAHSDGGAGVAAESAASLGLEYRHGPERTLSLGIGWAEPASETHGARLDDEYVLELSYQLQLMKNISLTPDIQWLVNPARQPQEDHVWVLGLRAVLTF